MGQYTRKEPSELENVALPDWAENVPRNRKGQWGGTSDSKEYKEFLNMRRCLELGCSLKDRLAIVRAMTAQAREGSKIHADWLWDRIYGKVANVVQMSVQSQQDLREVPIQDLVALLIGSNAKDPATPATKAIPARCTVGVSPPPV